MRANKEPERSNYAGNQIAIGVILDVLIFVIISKSIYIAVVAAIGAALDWKRQEIKDNFWRLLGLLAAEISSYLILKGCLVSLRSLKKNRTLK